MRLVFWLHMTRSSFSMWQTKILRKVHIQNMFEGERDVDKMAKMKSKLVSASLYQIQFYKVSWMQHEVYTTLSWHLSSIIFCNCTLTEFMFGRSAPMGAAHWKVKSKNFTSSSASTTSLIEGSINSITFPSLNFLNACGMSKPDTNNVYHTHFNTKAI